MNIKSERFEDFVLSVDEIHKSISRVKNFINTESGVKNVHTLWLYQLFMHPDGLTFAELAAKSGIDRSLVSREIGALAAGGFVSSEKSRGRRSYNLRISLTEKGRSLAKKIADAALRAQNNVSRDIEKRDLEVFYTVLGKIKNNLSRYTAESEKDKDNE